MNDLQNLGVLCAKCNECATELACLKYCDPNLIIKDLKNFYRNAFCVMHLYNTLYEPLKKQMFSNCSSLIIYLFSILQNMQKEFILLDKALTQFTKTRDYSAYYKTIYKLEDCSFHKVGCVKLINGKEVSVEISNFNDLERLLCKINVIFPLIKVSDGLNICMTMIEALCDFIGVSPVARYELYPSEINCYVCYEELQVLPNNGQSVSKRLKSYICEHLTKMCPFNFSGEEYLRVLEHDLCDRGALTDEIKSHLIAAKKSLQITSEEEQNNDTESILNQYDLFTKNIPEHVYALSDLTYWSKTSEKILHTTTITLKQLNIFNEILKNVKKKLAIFLHGCESHDCFDIFSHVIDKQHCVFIGSLFTSLTEVTSVLANQCLQAFEGNVLFKDAKESNELNSTVKSIIASVKEDMSQIDLGSYRAAKYNIGAYDVYEEVKARKKQYFTKIANVGYAKIKDSIERESKQINKLIHINTIGNVCFEMLSKILNMFNNRNRLSEFIENGINLLAITNYDNHLHIRNNLGRQVIGEETKTILVQQMFMLLNGPLFDHRHDYFPLPGNIDMAYAYDNAEILPHRKEEFMQCVHATWCTHEWMVSSYNEFFCLKDCPDINVAQQKVWKFVKELVIAVALYNDLYGHKLQIFRIDEASPIASGVYITYDSEIPLLLKTANNIIYGNDVYALLYVHATH